LVGSPVLVQDVSEVNFQWGFGSPGPSVPTDYFSARYERTTGRPVCSPPVEQAADEHQKEDGDQQNL
jgi:hypothetical protein